jgi:hypothetical protein
MSETDDDPGFGGGNEDGVLCACERRVRTPHCPWCGRRMDDAGAQLLGYLERLAESGEKAAATKEKRGDRYPSENSARTVERLRQGADQRRQWAAWVRARIG